MINGAERQNVKRRTGLKFCNKELRLLYPLNQVLLLWMCLLCRKLKHVGKMNPDECKQKLLELNNLLQVPHQHTRLHKMSCVFSSRSNCLEPQRTRCVCAGPMHKHKSTQRLNTQSTWLSQVGPSLLEWCNWIYTLTVIALSGAVSEVVALMAPEDYEQSNRPLLKVCVTSLK